MLDSHVLMDQFRQGPEGKGALQRPKGYPSNLGAISVASHPGNRLVLGWGTRIREVSL